ncbi:hypothetical protein ACH5RR_037294 [Cinchona calisaya]|uniref:B box-type domain-containing protein n=1 Tax=Cinchona calisaya TaxID=153742 RepID=A0ABD2Y9H6_9GENT
MKIQCSSCGEEEARLFCCADEAALCYGCDEKIHAANKLASKHQRVSLSTSSSLLPKCDICQETFGYFICLEDRALLCRKCDVAIHTMNSFVSSHQRFLLTGVKVRSESAVLGNSMEKVTAPLSISRTSRDSSVGPSQVATPSQDGNAVESWSTGASKMPVDCGNATTGGSQFEFQGLIGSNLNNPSSQDGLPKVDGKVHGNSEWSKILRSTEEQLLNDEWATPDDVSWTVPELLYPYSLPDSCSVREATEVLANNVLSISNAACPESFPQCHQNS